MGTAQNNLYVYSYLKLSFAKFIIDHALSRAERGGNTSVHVGWKNLFKLVSITHNTDIQLHMYKFAFLCKYIHHICPSPKKTIPRGPNWFSYFSVHRPWFNFAFCRFALCRIRTPNFILSVNSYLALVGRKYLILSRLCRTNFYYFFLL